MLTSMMWDITKMTIADLDLVLDIERRSFPDPWTREMFLAEMKHPFSQSWVVKEVSGKIAGFICFWLIEGEVHFLDLAVDIPYRRQGIGELLIRRALVWSLDLGAGKAFLEVRESNRPARELYQKLGFKVVTRRRGYYGKPKEDALVMGLMGPWYSGMATDGVNRHRET
jgi:ribosomal-protein-alanine N-acetyltransferase